MAPIRSRRTCVICKSRYGRIIDNKRKFMTKFPIDEDRCRRWVKIIGNEDLAYIPIEKLHEMKYVCGDHFQPKDFNKKRNRLKKWAVPSVLINVPPLSDHLLVEFPCHVANSEQNVTYISSKVENKNDEHAMKRHLDHSYCERTSLKIARCSSISKLSASSSISSPRSARSSSYCVVNFMKRKVHIVQYTEKNMTLSSKKCCVPGCNDSDGMKPPLHLFPNPTKDKQRFNAWIFSIRGDIIGMDDFDIYKRRRVCHAHFEEKFCCRNNKLSNIALPTLHLPGSLTLPKFTFAERRPLRLKEKVDSKHTPSLSKTQKGPSSGKGNKTTSKVFDRGNRHTDDDKKIELIAQPHTARSKFSDISSNLVLEPTCAKLDSGIHKGVEYTLNETESGEQDAGDIIEFIEENDLTAVPEELYTWQKKPLVCTDDIDEISDDELPVEGQPLTTLTGEVDPENTDYVCNECNCYITGVRYKCVQCSDYDVCAACEAHGVHSLHYALRVPEHSVQVEVLKVIEAIRKCLNENPSMVLIQEDEGIKEEFKDELEEDNNQNVKEFDPLTKEELPNPQASENKDDTHVHTVPGQHVYTAPVSHPQTVPVKPKNTFTNEILVRPKKSSAVPLGHAITIPVGHTKTSLVNLVNMQKGGSKDIGNSKHIDVRKKIMKANIIPIKKTKISSQIVSARPLSRLKTVVDIKRVADSNLKVSKVYGKLNQTIKNPVIVLEDLNTRKIRHIASEDKLESPPVKLKKSSLITYSRSQQSEQSSQF